MVKINRKKTPTADYEQQVKNFNEVLSEADAVVIGAGSGLSTADGLRYEGDRFHQYFADFRDKYGITNIYSGGFYAFPSPEEQWAWWSRQVYHNRYNHPVGDVYKRLLALVQDKEYFVITTNVDHKFFLAGFDPNRIFAVQGDYGLWQCSIPCRQTTVNNEAAIREMMAAQKDMQIPSDLIPYCENCGAPMAMNLRADRTFVQDEHWYAAQKRYDTFLQQHNDQMENVLFIELGVGLNTPSIIKYPFWRKVAYNPNATYACLNNGEVLCPTEIKDQLICLDDDIAKVLKDLTEARA